MKKPCIQCNEECEIFPVQLGDFFTLTLLRICSPECMFKEAYDYLYDIGYHKSFRGHLYDRQNEEDSTERNAYIEEITEKSLKMMKEDLEKSPQLLSKPVPTSILKMFENFEPIPQSSGTMSFTRFSKDEKLKWQARRVKRLKKDLLEALKELEDLEND